MWSLAYIYEYIEGYVYGVVIYTYILVLEELYIKCEKWIKSPFAA